MESIRSLLVSAATFLGIFYLAIVYAVMQVRNRVPQSLQDLTDQMLQDPDHQYLCDQIQQCDYFYRASFAMELSQGVPTYCDLFQNRDATNHFMVVDAVPNQGSAQRVLMATTHFANDVSINLDTNSPSGVFSNPPGKIVLHLPKHKDIAQFIAVHEMLVHEAQKLALSALAFPLDTFEDVERLVLDELQRDHEYMVGLGRMKPASDGSFRYTISGAIPAAFRFMTSIPGRLNPMPRGNPERLRKAVNRRLVHGPGAREFSS